MNDDLERNLRDSLDQHATGAGASGGNLNDVYHRVDMQHRRRSLAVIGSVAALAGGVIGFAAFAAGSSEQPVDLAAAAATNGPTTTTVWPSTNVYACTNYLGSQEVPAYGQRELYGDCVPVTWDAGVVVDTTIQMVPCVSTTMLTTTTVPMTTMVAMCESYPTGTVPPLTAPATSVPVTAPNCLSGAIAPVSTAPPTSTIVATGEQQYTVVAGDSLIGIAAMFGVAPDIIANYNVWFDCLDHPLFVGDTVLIPPGALIPAG